MQRMLLAFVSLVFAAWLVPASAQPAEGAMKRLQGSWVASKAERDGKPADDVVGHRLTFTGRQFQIEDRGGKTVFKGTATVNASTKPAAIDFLHAEGMLKGKLWKGIYALDGSTLRICDNAEDLGKPRPGAFAAQLHSGYVLITFARDRK